MNEQRYARHQLIPGWQQQRLAQARVIIVGVGALGNEVSRLLALSGVGAMLLCDPDQVASSNLSRTALFGPGDVGRLKVEAAAASLGAYNPKLHLCLRPHNLVHGIGLGELGSAHLVLSCLDSREARLQLTGRCNLVRAPLLDAGTHAWGGELRPFLDPDGPCYGCGLSPAQRAQSDLAISCHNPDPNAPTAASAIVSASVGAAMAAAAVRHLMGLFVPAANLVMDCTTGLTYASQRQRDPHCLLHQPLATSEPVPVGNQHTLAQLKQHLAPKEKLQLWAPGPHHPPGQTLTVRPADAKKTLSQLGIPPGEILIVENSKSSRLIRLNPAPDWPIQETSK